MDSDDKSPELVRGLGLPQAISLNVLNMIGIGPFITIPLFMSKMQGPQALIAWLIAAVLVICDGLVWSELGAALPGSGGTYHFLKEIFGRHGGAWARIIPFLFIWQFLISGTLELASGYIGAIQYLEYILSYWRAISPSFENFSQEVGSWMQYLHLGWGGLNWIAAVTCVCITLSLCRRIETIGCLGVALCVGAMVTVLTVIGAGLANFNPSLITFPPDAFDFSQPGYFGGLGAAMTIAIYDYFGYYNVCHLGDEVKNPGQTIPRAVIVSVLLVAGIYLTMNISIIGVVPYPEVIASKNIAATFMEKLYGRPAAAMFTLLILWTALACVFAGTLGYSRIPFAAAQNGDFFSIFTTVHPTRRYPVVSLWTLGGLTAFFCFFPLDAVISAAVTVRIVIQFIMQIIALHVLRKTRPDVKLPFRMALYPIPSLIALLGWIFILATSPTSSQLAGLLVLISGVVVFFFYLWNPGARQIAESVKDEGDQ